MPKTEAVKFSKRTIDALTPESGRDVVVRDAQLDGLRVRVRSTGRKTFEYRYRAHGRDRLIVIGEHGELSVEEAVRKAREFAGEVAKGGDPQAERAKKRFADTTALTVQDLIDLYLLHGPRDKPDKRESSWNLDRTNFTRHVAPLLGRRRVDQLTMTELTLWQADVLNGKTARIEKTRSRGLARVRGGRGAASRSMQAVNAMFEWALRAELVTRNPAKYVKRLASGTKERYLSEEEGAAVWDAIDALETEGRIPLTHADCFRLIALTGARRGEIVGLRWSEVDHHRRMLLLPPLRHKTGGMARPKSIPLPTPALDILERHRDLRLPGAVWVFPKEDGSGPMEPPKKSWRRIAVRAGVPDVTPHILRHTLASWAVADGASFAIIGKILGHSRPSTTARYAHLRHDAGQDVLDAVALRYRRRPAA